MGGVLLHISNNLTDMCTAVLVTGVGSSIQNCKRRALLVSSMTFDLVSGSRLAPNLPNLMHRWLVDVMTWHLRFQLTRVIVIIADLVAQVGLLSLVCLAQVSIGGPTRHATT